MRISALLHIADDTTPGAWLRPIEAETVRRAGLLGRYFAAHALAAFDFMGGYPELHDARVVGRWAAERD